MSHCLLMRMQAAQAGKCLWYISVTDGDTVSEADVCDMHIGG